MSQCASNKMPFYAICWSAIRLSCSSVRAAYALPTVSYISCCFPASVSHFSFPITPTFQDDRQTHQCEGVCLWGEKAGAFAENSSAGGLRHMVPLTFSAVMGACWQPFRGHEPDSTQTHSASPPSLLCLIIRLSTPISTALLQLLWGSREEMERRAERVGCRKKIPPLGIFLSELGLTPGAFCQECYRRTQSTVFIVYLYK